jgi:ATP-binding cassette subfamily B protein
MEERSRQLEADATSSREAARGFASASAREPSGLEPGASETATRQTGLKALAAVARRHGLDWSIERLLHVYGADSEPDAARLAAIAREEGLQSSVQSTNWTQLSRFRGTAPFLARLTTGGYVVLLQTPSIPRNLSPAQAREEKIVVFNPRAPEANLFQLSRSEFETFWTGEIVLLKRVYRLTDAAQPFGLRWFIPELLRQRPLFGNVIVAALAMHILALAVPIFFQLVIDRVLVYQSLSTLAVLGIGVLMAILFDAILNWLRGYFLLRASSRIDIRLARTTFRHMLALPLGFFERSLAGVVTKHMQQASRIREFLTGRLLMTLLDLPALLVFVPVLAFYNVQLMLVVLGITMMLAFVIAVMIGPYRRRLKRLYRAEAERQSLLVESIHGMRTVKSLNLEPRRQEALEIAAANAVNTHVEVGKISLAANTLTSFIERGLTIVIVVLGAFAVFAGDMSVGELVAFNMLSTRVISPVLQMIGLLNQYQETLMSVEMLGEIMNKPVEHGTARGLTPPLEGAIQIDDVTFRYPNNDRPALSRFSVEIPAGAFIGIVGRSGSGKTTLSALLQGLYFASEGAVRIDGHNIRDIDLAYLRGQTGVVPQDPFLFRGSVKDNIRLGRPTASFEEVVEAARAAGADEFIEQLPQRYDTEIEEGGVNLSGGQKQRLSIARALLRRPRIIIFDEATSALDPESEAVVVRNLGKIAKGRTTIVISHRLQTIREADAILVMDEGRLADSGSHSDLLGRNLIYRQLWAQQVGRPA